MVLQVASQGCRRAPQVPRGTKKALGVSRETHLGKTRGRECYPRKWAGCEEGSGGRNLVLPIMHMSCLVPVSGEVPDHCHLTLSLKRSGSKRL